MSLLAVRRIHYAAFKDTVYSAQAGCKVEDLLRASVEFLGSPTFSPTKDPGNGRFVVPVDQKKYWSGELLFYLDKKGKSSFWRQKI